jgi:hypothetical protein
VLLWWHLLLLGSTLCWWIQPLDGMLEPEAKVEHQDALEINVFSSSIWL